MEINNSLVSLKEGCRGNYRHDNKLSSCRILIFRICFGCEVAAFNEFAEGIQSKMPAVFITQAENAVPFGHHKFLRKDYFQQICKSSRMYRQPIVPL
jgi:hypothetical protein